MAEFVPASFDVKDSQNPKLEWTLAFRSDGFRLESKTGHAPALDVSRSDRAGRVTLVDGLFLRRTLMVRAEGKNVLFRLPPPAWDALEAWYPPHTREDLRAVLKRRLSWSFMIGILYLLPAILFLINRDGSLQAKSIDWINAGLGGALIFMGVMSKIAPHRIFLLLDSLWCGLLLANTVQGILAKTATWSWYVAAYFQVTYIRDGLREFWRFRPEAMATEETPPEGR